MTGKTKQDTIDGKAVFKSMNKKIIKGGRFKGVEVNSHEIEDIVAHAESLGRDKFYALTSGGKDSMGVCHWLADHGKLESATFIRTGVGIQMTEDFVQDTCHDNGWHLDIIESQIQNIYISHVISHGFPTPGIHSVIMGKLKYSVMRNYALTINRYGHWLASGVRNRESANRMRNYQYPIQFDGDLAFCSPFFYKSDQEVYRYIHENGLSITPVHAKLGMSGECMCGSYARPREKEIIMELDPNLAAFIKWLEEGIQIRGTAQAKRYPTWGGSARMSELEEQTIINNFFKENPEMNNLEKLKKNACGTDCLGMNEYDDIKEALDKHEAAAK